uniref:chitinase n=1 Tax=Hirsutella thompsonii TaxID=42368 RepID=A0A097F8L9_HIRTH|nr:chitinase [Hirsutella thompsonii]
MKGFVSHAFLLALAVFQVVSAEPDYSCSKTKPCKVGCCAVNADGVGVCGGGPEFCSPPKCISQCGWKSECDPGWGIQWSNASTCPLNVCCSDFGFCGTTKEFCKGKTVASPECGADKRTAEGRTVGYYEGWSTQRECGAMRPDEIPLGRYTHINFAFAYVYLVDHGVAHMDSTTMTLYRNVTALKARQPGLQVWIAVGGWAMNDPDSSYTTAFSDMARTNASQDIFIDSLIAFMVENDFDGVDLDWEYPVAEDRGGSKDDFENYAILLRRMREKFNGLNKRYGISIAIPASYWYLRGFNLKALEPSVDWFNIMTYDIHGTWDSVIPSLGPYAYAHNNLTEINDGLELLWRNDVKPENVNLGLGFYGRGFTMADPKCMAPGCPYKNSTGTRRGRCTKTPGMLSAAEIGEILKKGANSTFYEKEAVQVVTWDRDQWLSWDDARTIKMKREYANKRCLGGTMVWAIDLDDGTLNQALGNATLTPQESVQAPSQAVKEVFTQPGNASSCEV